MLRTTRQVFLTDDFEVIDLTLEAEENFPMDLAEEDVAPNVIAPSPTRLRPTRNVY
ncbi:hypothetical protein DAPPUDRAFT_267785 [Daphnia pulex]|uniref:Uncharacterized protein n=1 Tax=Daphnia pulex TaxID=6669 RepID=E9HWY2_DAPPU|nr:hypothetical protein DAPPUDRAFT_267785 [Daphnia pulex]|eukprot:EFX63748.1 hypothetical protein DAPPUDRAFT_267785 [Daphnia pulex]